MNEEMVLEYCCQILRLVGFIFGIISLKIEIDSLNTEGIVLSLHDDYCVRSYVFN